MVNESLTGVQLGLLPPAGTFALYYVSMLLLSHGDNVLGQPDWLHKIETFQQTLRTSGRRWRIAGKFLLEAADAPPWDVILMTSKQRGILAPSHCA
jgi:hypothetical protein